MRQESAGFGAEQLRQVYSAVSDQVLHNDLLLSVNTARAIRRETRAGLTLLRVAASIGRSHQACSTSRPKCFSTVCNAVARHAGRALEKHPWKRTLLSLPTTAVSSLVAALVLNTAASPTSLSLALNVTASQGAPDAAAARAAVTSLSSAFTPSDAALAATFCFLSTRAISLLSAARQSSASPMRTIGLCMRATAGGTDAEGSLRQAEATP